MTTLAQINETLKLQLELMAQQHEDIVKSNEDVVDLKDKISQSLQFQNQLVSQQEKSLSRVSDSIIGLKERIAESIKQQRSDRLDVIEETRETRKIKERDSSTPRGFMAGLGQGSGFSWLTDFLGTLFSPAGVLGGLLAGALGLVAGKIIKFGVIAGLIALFFSDELIAFAQGFENLTGIDLVALIAENPLIAAALGIVAVEISKFIARSLLTGLGRALGGAIFGGPDIDDGKNRRRGPKTPATKPKDVPKPQQKPGQKAPQPRGPNGRYQPKTPKGPSPKVPGGLLPKLLPRVLGPIGLLITGFQMFDAAVSYGKYEADEEIARIAEEEGLTLEEARKEWHRRREEQGFKEDFGIAYEEMANKGPADVLKGDNPYVVAPTPGIDPIALQGRINAFQAYGVDRDRQRMSATERGISRTSPTTASNLTQAAANARISAIINNAPVINNITNNNGGGGNTSVMTVPVGTADVSDRRDIIRRYGR